MDRPDLKRGFLNGLDVAVGAMGAAGGLFAGAAGGLAAGQHRLLPAILNRPARQPPRALFEKRPPLRDGDLWSAHSGIEDTGEALRLSRGWAAGSAPLGGRFLPAARPQCAGADPEQSRRIRSHAKRNEFQMDGSMHLLNGGTQDIDSHNHIHAQWPRAC